MGGKKTVQAEKKEKAWDLFIGVVLSGLIAGGFQTGNTILQNKLPPRGEETRELEEILDRIAVLDSLISSEFYLYLTIRETLAGHEAYGPEFIDESRKAGKTADTFTALKRKEIQRIKAKLENRFGGKKRTAAAALLDSLTSIENLFVDLFFEQHETLRWKQEPLMQEMLMYIYQDQVETIIQILYQEVRALYEKT